MMTDETANRRLEPFLLCDGLIVVLEIWRDFPKDQIKKSLASFTQTVPRVFCSPNL